jgi:hypothetical protein
MKKIYTMATLIMMGFASQAQLTTVAYRGAFEPFPATAWTDSWTEFDPQNKVYPLTTDANVVIVNANITTNTTWTADKVYYLKEQIYVKNNAILTIQPGTIIMSEKKPAPDPTATPPIPAAPRGLVITKGSKLNAIGTASQPIVFTSDQTVGNRNKGDWGGIILLGKSAYNINNGFNNIEGIAVGADTEFGANPNKGETVDLADNSGTLKYVRIEFGGYVFAANQEINGLTLGAVGSGTVIDYVQTSFINDDSYEWFGGSVNCSHLVAYRGLDDDWDTDNGFSGNVQFCLGIRDPQISDNPSVSTSNGFESDNNATSVDGTSFTTCTFSNVTEIGPHFRFTLPNHAAVIAPGFGRMAHLRRNGKQKILNSVLMDYNNGINIDGYVTVVGATTNTETNALNGEIQFKNNILAGSTKNAYVNTPTVAIPNNNNPKLDIAVWYAGGNNLPAVLTGTLANTGILIKPYDLADAKVYTGLDYRPSATSIAATGAVFSGNLATKSFNVADQANVFKVYPNAFATTFRLSYATTGSENISIAVYTTQGKLVENRIINAFDINEAEFGDTYATGVYLVKMTQGATTKTVRAIKK